MKPIICILCTISHNPASVVDTVLMDNLNLHLYKSAYAQTEALWNRKEKGAIPSPMIPFTPSSFHSVKWMGAIS